MNGAPPSCDDSNREALARAGEERRKFQAGLKKS
jgi:hypothetical protein